MQGSARKRRGAGSGDRLVLISVAATDPDRADDRSTAPQWNAAGEDHHAPVIGGVDAKEQLARLAVFGELPSLDIESARAVNALLIEISMLPIQAPFIRTWLTRFPPVSTTAMFIG